MVQFQLARRESRIRYEFGLLNLADFYQDAAELMIPHLSLTELPHDLPLSQFASEDFPHPC